MVDNKSIVDKLIEFNKIIDDFQTIKVKFDDEDKVILFLISSSRSFEYFKDVFLYGKEDNITLEEVRSAIKTKELGR